MKALLSSFSCQKDLDIESFLRERAVRFEALEKSRTYLIFDADNLEQTGTELPPVLGYFSLALSVFSVPPDTPVRQRLSFDGFSGKRNGKAIESFPCYLIGQLARNSNVPKDAVSGKEIIQSALEKIADCVDIIGGRIVLIECHNDNRLIRFYEENGFTVADRQPDDTRPMVQMIRKLQ